MFIIILAIQNSVFIPLSISFDFKKEIFDTLTFRVLDTGADIMFIIDIMIMFFTSYRDMRGHEVYSSQPIATEYLTSVSFVLDFLSTLGSGFLEGVIPFNTLFGFFKMTRVRRLSKFVAMLTIHKESKAYIQIIQLVFFLSLWLHCLACFWFYTVKISGQNQYDAEGNLIY